MKILKGILEEQLDNAIRLKKDYIKTLAQLGHGSIIKKKIYNHDYYYNEYRDGSRIVFEYLGRLKPEEIEVFSDNRHRREEYKRMIRELDRQISFLEKALCAKEIRNV